MPSAVVVGKWLVEFMNKYETKTFRKTGDYVITNERSMLKLVKFFFLGKYSKVGIEVKSSLGRIDFAFGDLALEVAVRNKSGRGHLLVSQNRSEMRKLRRHNGKSALALINMEKESAAKIDSLIDDYREHSLGKGNYRRVNPVTILAIARADSGYVLKRFVVRTPQ